MLALGWQPPPKPSSMPPREALLALGWAPPEEQTDLPGLATSPLSNASQRSGTATPTSHTLPVLATIAEERAEEAGFCGCP